MQHTPLDELQITRKPHNHYGSLEDMLRQIRAHRPLDLNAERWHEAHPQPLRQPGRRARGRFGALRALAGYGAGMGFRVEGAGQRQRRLKTDLFRMELINP